jgi:hypothetical protein
VILIANRKSYKKKKCVGDFYFHIAEGICFAGFFALFFLHVVTLHISIRVSFCSVLRQTDKHTRKKQQQKLTKKNRTGKTQMKTCRVLSRAKKKSKKKTSEAGI